MTDHFHDIGDLIRCNYTSPLALSANIGWHSVFVRLEYCGLMETDDGGVDIHIAEYNVGIRKSSR
jgi:hypothetical protein